MGQASPPWTLRAAVVPMRRSAAGAIGIAAVAPPTSAGSKLSAGRSGRGQPERQVGGSERGAVNGQRVPGVVAARDGDALDTAAGVSPALAFPKLMLGRSSAIESTPWMSMSTAAFPETPCGEAAGYRARAAAVAEFRGAGVSAEKSLAFASVSVHPPPARSAAVVLLSAGAASAPS